MNMLQKILITLFLFPTFLLAQDGYLYEFTPDGYSFTRSELQLNAINPEFEILKNRGFVKATLQDFDGAMQDFQKALEINPANPYVLYFIGNIYMDYYKKLDSAIAYYNQSISIYSTFEDVYNNRALAYQKQGKHNIALQDFNLAISIKPRASYYHNRALSLKSLGLMSEACSDFLRCHELGDTDCHILYQKYCGEK